MYLATAEVAKVIAKAAKPPGKKDGIHSEHLEYLIFSNLVANGSLIMMRHGIFPNPSGEMHDIMPSMTCFHEFWNDPASDEAKEEVYRIVHNGFGSDMTLFTEKGKRNLGKLDTWQETRPLLALQLILQGYKINKEGKGEIVLMGGKLKPCTFKPKQARDCMYFEANETAETTKVTCFSNFILASNNHFLNPQTIAAMIYEGKATAASEKRQIQKEKKDFDPWQSNNGDSSVYIKVQPLNLTETKDGGTGGGADDDDEDSKEDDSNALLKNKLATPLKKLCKGYEKLSGILYQCNEDAGADCPKITKRVRAAQNLLKNTVRKQLEEIATIADVYVDLSGKDEDKIDQERTPPIPPQKEQKQMDSASAADEDTLTLKDFAKLQNCTREDISKFLTTLIESEDDIDLKEINLMTTTKKGEILRPWLGLQKIPQTNAEMKFFCLLWTSKKEEIRAEYMNKKRSKNDTWIKKLASFIGELKNFKWSNSFDDLADVERDQDSYMLLWLDNDDFEKHFFSVES